MHKENEKENRNKTFVHNTHISPLFFLALQAKRMSLIGKSSKSSNT